MQTTAVQLHTASINWIGFVKVIFLTCNEHKNPFSADCKLNTKRGGNDRKL